MATRLSDLVIPELWTPNFLLESKELTNFFGSGIVAVDPVIAALASGEGSTFHLRHMNDLANDAENLSSDDPDQKSTAKKIAGSALTAVKCLRNQSWSSMDMAAALHMPDPVDAIRSRVAAYWQRRFQAVLVSQATGIMAANAAAGSSDMIYNHTSTGDGKISGTAIINARATMGDAAEDLDQIVMHSVCKANLDKQNLITYLRDKDGSLIGESYLGFRVVVDDGMPVDVTDPQNPVFTSMLFKSGFFRMGMGSAKVPTEIERVAASGNGEGEEVLYSRQQFILHPTGFSYKSSVGNPANTEFAKAAAWERKFARKQTPLAFIKTKG